MNTYKISLHQVLPLGKVGPIKMRQLARGHIDERSMIIVRHRSIVKGYGSKLFVVVATTLLLAPFLVSLGDLLGDVIISIIGAT